MTLSMAAEPVPLRLDADGAARVANTRVTLDTLVEAFKDGASAEEIAQQYPSLALADLYSILGYYLRRQDEVEAYLHAAPFELRASNFVHSLRELDHEP